MAREERSAGVLLFRIDPDSGRRRFLLLDYGKYWDYPKGHVEEGEGDLAAARRELLEETGIADAAIVDGFSHEIRYYFRSKRKGLVHKSVIFFLGKTESPEVRLSHEHVGFDWLEYEPALERLNYESAREVLREAQEYLTARERSS
jgi:bis(5'-nucleosidyl)-tetraphosphatase